MQAQSDGGVGVVRSRGEERELTTEFQEGDENLLKIDSHDS